MFNMYKLTYNLMKIDDRINIDVSMYIQNDEQLATSKLMDAAKEKAKTYRVYAKGMDKYISFNTRAFIEIKIDPWQKDINDPNKYIKCNRYDIFRLTKAFDIILVNFKSVKDLFFYDTNKKLHLNDDLKDKASLIVPLKEKTLKIVPSLIEDTVSGSQHEGVTIFVNTNNSYCFLTYTELEYMNHVLKSVDIDTITSTLYLIEEQRVKGQNNTIPRN